MSAEHPLARWRKFHGWTQTQLAEACGLSHSMITHVENYRRIPLREALERLLDVTGLPTDALVRPERFLAAHPNFLRRPPKA
jgi:transcriptional regulator with XRE-family HTH domain